MKIGFIGVGNIGSMLVKRFLEFTSPRDILIFDLNQEKCKELEEQLELNVSQNIESLAKDSDIIFLCVRPQNLREVLKNLGNTVNKIFVTTVAAINQETYYGELGKIELIRIIPSMINKVGGPVLFCPGKYTSENTKRAVKEQISKIGKVFEVEEDKIDGYTHIASCSPAIIAEFVRLYVDSLVKEKKIDGEIALKMIHDVLPITSQSLKEEGFDIIPQVCTKGGITELGIGIMNKHKETFFSDITKTLLDRMENVRKEYGEY